MATTAKIKAISPWFGANRMLAKNVGDALKGCVWVGVPFAGGMSELAHIDARTIVVSDLHRHVVNLAVTISEGGDELARRLADLPFHPDILRAAQERCALQANAILNGDSFGDEPWAMDYFICSWMGRSGFAGTDKEFKGGLPVRWGATGGDSNTRYRSAVESLAEWQKIMRRCNFVCQDVFEFLDKVKDEPEHGIYADPPWVGDGDCYTHKFTEDDHRALAVSLTRDFTKCRIVVRYGDAPLIRQIYPASAWNWTEQTSRTQGNSDKPEVLIVRRR